MDTARDSTTVAIILLSRCSHLPSFRLTIYRTMRWPFVSRVNDFVNGPDLLILVVDNVACPSTFPTPLIFCRPFTPDFFWVIADDIDTVGFGACCDAEVTPLVTGANLPVVLETRDLGFPLLARRERDGSAFAMTSGSKP